MNGRTIIVIVIALLIGAAAWKLRGTSGKSTPHFRAWYPEK